MRLLPSPPAYLGPPLPAAGVEQDVQGYARGVGRGPRACTDVSS